MSTILERAAQKKREEAAAAAKANNEAEFGTWTSPFNSYGRLSQPRDPCADRGGHVSTAWHAKAARGVSEVGASEFNNTYQLKTYRKNFAVGIGGGGEEHINSIRRFHPKRSANARVCPLLCRSPGGYNKSLRIEPRLKGVSNSKTSAD